MPKVLIADDEPNIVHIVTVCLEMEGFEVITACDGVGALDTAAAQLPDLIILDDYMPRLDGMEVLRRLGYQQDTRKIPVIMFANNTGNSAVTEAREMGVREYLAKPFDRDRLLAAVRKALSLQLKPAT